jgi:hypothetical protein
VPPRKTRERTELAPAEVPLPDSPDGETCSLLDGLRNGTWLDKQEFPPLRYHVDGIIPEGLTVLAGAPKVGKSWLILGCGLAVAAGGRALSTIWCEQREVFYLALEDGDRRMQDRCRTLLGRQWQYAPADPIPEQFTYMTRIVPGQIIPTIAEYLETYGALKPLVIVDTLGRVLPPAVTGETPYSRDYRIMSQLKDLADRWPGASLLLCHHDRKAVTADFVDSVSGTNGIAGGADTVLVLTRDRGSAEGLLQVTGRDVGEGSYAVSFEWGAWTLDGASLDEAATAARTRSATAGLDDRSANIVTYVDSQAGPVTPAAAADALGLDGDTAGRYMRRLADTGRIRRLSRGHYTTVRSDRMSETEGKPDDNFGHSDASDTGQDSTR